MRFEGALNAFEGAHLLLILVAKCVCQGSLNALKGSQLLLNSWQDAYLRGP